MFLVLVYYYLVGELLFVIILGINIISNIRMAIKLCCIQDCKSQSTRSEDIGVTYHKFPREVSLCNIWIKATRHSLTKSNTPAYVCSRHFCKSDFQIYKDSKYVLKSDAVPSIFSWVIKDFKSTNKDMETTNEEINDAPNNQVKESEGENLEAIKMFIEQQEKEFNDHNNKKDVLQQQIETKKDGTDVSKDFDDRMEVASSMMDMILSESEERIAFKKKSGNASAKQHEKAPGSTALSVGSKVEAKDFSELWYPAQIMEVDYEEMEVLVHYENSIKKHDEWISVSSPRLRPRTIPAVPVAPTVEPVEAPTVPETADARSTVEEHKTSDDKPKLAFVIGERCLAKWRDNRRFVATVSKDLGDGHYEVVFDDGFQWKCTTSRMYKLKDMSNALAVDTASTPSASAESPVLYGSGPSTAQPLTPVAAFHTHLFDPTRDYLGSKSERREMKRKLNIKEIFNIGQKRSKKQAQPKEKTATPRPPVEKMKKPKIIRKKTAKAPVPVPKRAIPDAVASIIGSCEDTPVVEATLVVKEEQTEINDCQTEVTVVDPMLDCEDDKEDDNAVVEEEKPEDTTECDTKDKSVCNGSDLSNDSKTDTDPVQEEEVKLEKFEKEDDVRHEEVIDRMKEVINKLEDGINEASSKPDTQSQDTKPEPKPELTVPKVEPETDVKVKKEKKLSKIKKGKKLRLLQEKKVKKQVEKVKTELEVMKRQFEEMRKQMLAKTEELVKGQHEMPESFLLPGEWCCKWVNGQPVGMVSELEGEVRDVNSKPGLPRRSVQVEDKRLPPGWTKHMVRRSLGHSAGKWDVVLVSPDHRRFHTRTDMRNYMENNDTEPLRGYEHALMDFGVHLKLSRRMGWVTTTPGGVDDTPVVSLPAGTLSSTSPLIKRRKLSLKRTLKEEKKKKLKIAIKMPKHLVKDSSKAADESGGIDDVLSLNSQPELEAPPLEDGYVWVGSLKVQIIENLLRCPADGCYKNFRNNTLLKMHIKHYHRELRKMLGRTPKVLDLAYARTMPTGLEHPKAREPDLKTLKVKLPKLPKRTDEPKQEVKEEKPELAVESPTIPEDIVPKLQDSPKLRNALVTKKRPRVLLPVRRPDPEIDEHESIEISQNVSNTSSNFPLEYVDFETAISTHTVTKPAEIKKEKKAKALLPRSAMSEEDEWMSMTSDVETRSSFPRSESPDSKSMEPKFQSSETKEQKQDKYMYTETGERIKIVHMKREEIINCHCGFREEDGLMVQCELCLCWQHALCQNINKESEVPENYTCSICLNPRRGRRSQRHLHSQERLYLGRLAGGRPSLPLRRAHELSGNLLRLGDALHAARLQCHVASKKDHPKLYLWAKDWENGELAMTQDRLLSDYSDLNVMMGDVGKENLPLKPDEMNAQLDMQTPPLDESERFNAREGLGLLASPASLDLPISAAELERLARSVQEEVLCRVVAPTPEAAIESGACRERLLRHIQRCQAMVDARLDSIEAQVAELESQDPSFEDDETADYFPRTKQTIQMLLRDLDTMEELGVIT